MARIIFSTVSGLPNSSKLPCFYEGFTAALAREGNEVLVIINNKFIKNHWGNNKTKKNVDKKKLSQEIMNFNPDLVITANNSLYEEIPNLVTCPIVIYCTDSPSGFVDRDILKDNIGRYHIFLPSETLIPMTREYFGYDMKCLEILQYATDFQAETMDQDKNISFIGTNFSFVGDKFRSTFDGKFHDPKYKADFIKFINLFKKDVLRKPDAYLAELGLAPDFLGSISHIELLNLFSSNFRIQTLAAIADLDLSLYGRKDWYNVCDYSLDTSLSFVDQEVSSVLDNQNIYNSSKVSINISHSQAGTAFSWRVRDVMACNSALVSDHREDIVTEFGKYVKIPTFTNPFDARILCQKLLTDEVWRKEIVAGSQLSIEEGHRFKHRIKHVQDILGITLLNDSKKGSLKFLNPDEFFLSPTLSQKLMGENGPVRVANRARVNLTRVLKTKMKIKKKPRL